MYTPFYRVFIFIIIKQDFSLPCRIHTKPPGMNFVRASLSGENFPVFTLILEGDHTRGIKRGLCQVAFYKRIKKNPCRMVYGETARYFIFRLRRKPRWSPNGLALFR